MILISLNSYKILSLYASSILLTNSHGMLLLWLCYSIQASILLARPL